MILLSCHVEHFGKLSKFDLNFEEGLQPLLRENGWGKTTLAVFIKAMLFGLPKTTKRKLDENERKKYTPWRGGAYGGELVFAVGEREYRIERYFGEVEGEDTFALYDNRTNKLSDDYGADVGERLFGLNAAAYERSTFFSGRNVEFDGAANSMTAKLNGLLEDEEDIGAYDKAIEKLDEARKRYKQDKGTNGLLDRLEVERYELNRKIEEAKRAERSLFACKERAEGIQRELTRANEALELAERRYEEAAEEKARLELQGRYRAMHEKWQEYRTSFSKEEEFFRGRIPTAEELDEIERKEREKKGLEGQRSALPLDDYTEVRRRFAGTAPSEELDTLKQHAAEADVLIKQVQTLRAVDGETYAQCGRELDLCREELSTLPLLTKEEALSKEVEAQNDFDAAAAAAGEHRKREKPFHQGRGGFIAGMLLSALVFAGGALAAVLLFVFKGGEMFPLLLILLALAALGLVGLCTLVPVFLLREKAVGRALLSYEKERQTIDEDIKQTSERLKETRLAVGNAMRREELLRRVSELEDEVDRYCRAQELLSELFPHEVALKPLGRRAENESWTVRYYRYSQAVENYRKYLVLTAKEEELTAQIEALQKELSAFEARYRANAAAVRSRLLTYEFYRNELKKQEEAISSFEEEKGIASDFLEEQLSDRTEEMSRDRKARLAEKAEIEERARKCAREEEGFAAIADALPELESLLLSKQAESAAATKKYETLKNTKKYLQRAREDLSARYMGKMQESLLLYLKEFQGERLGQFGFDTELSLVFRAEGKKQDTASLSKGYRAVLDFCARLSLIDALYPEEKPFLVLDDPLADLDGDNLKVALSALKRAASRYQILYFVCHESRLPEEYEA